MGAKNITINDIDLNNIFLKIKHDDKAKNLPNQAAKAVENHYKWVNAAKYLGCITIRVHEKCKITHLDEPISALDARAEYEVFQRFFRLTKGKTAVLISRPFSTVRMADCILVLEKGELFKSGTHDELLQNNGQFIIISFAGKGASIR